MRRVAFFLLGLLFSLTVRAEASRFDYYTLAVTLTPAFCDLNPEKRNSVQCRERMPVSVHGLWPERFQGRPPEYCDGHEFAVSQSNEKLLRRIMPDAGLRRYQWKKHGRCSGLAADRYFSMLTREFDELKWPEQFRARGRDVDIGRDVLLAELLRINPGVQLKGVVLRCSGKGRPPLLTEVRLCLSPEGASVPCSANYRPNCPAAVRIRAWR